MKHLSEQEILSLSIKEKISDKSIAHLKSCLYCQSLIAEENVLNKSIQESFNIELNTKAIDIRQDVFNKLDIDFKVSEKKDYFNEGILLLFVVTISISLYIYPISLDLSPIFSWIPIKEMNQFVQQYKMIFFGMLSFGMMYFIERIKYTYRSGV